MANNIELTKEMKEDYIKQGGNACPKCKSNNIETGKFEDDCNMAWVKIHCYHCNCTWQENYKLVDIELTSL